MVRSGVSRKKEPKLVNRQGEGAAFSRHFHNNPYDVRTIHYNTLEVKDDVGEQLHERLRSDDAAVAALFCQLLGPCDAPGEVTGDPVSKPRSELDYRFLLVLL